ncbi:RNA-guided endonuclease TnpB family protein [Paenibacillus sp. J2TS4]|uniref:RNA-guided endonuclease InsQ/TnpB family protein n=1 Tax=Paenibacillus sp. J2TS4 TaxID=2807194 RepID=UPI001B150E48|nr:RNA-guided endonuclease TnpB family protein [Paenibacillus sp. J2TS4]GIP35775.1 transposase [Paenibacillus sp. J2TS4]
MPDSTFMYRTQQVWIKPGHRLFAYLDQACQNAKNVYNTTNFYIRQVFTAFRSKKKLQPLQQQVLDTITAHVDLMNERRSNKNRLHPFQLPSQEKPFIHYHFLDALFKVIDQTDYRSLPAQSSQGIMKVVFHNWKAFFQSVKDYRKHPDKYNGPPRIPGYARSKVKEVVFSNQDCVIKHQKFLKFPGTQQQLNIGKLGCTDGKLMQVRVIPSHGQYVVEMVFAHSIEKKEVSSEHVLAIDLGVDNLATIVTTTGAKPVVVKGKIVKSINQYYNKIKAYYTGILRQGKKPREGIHTSRRLERLHLKRQRRIKDLFHKASHRIVHIAVEQKVGTIVIGHNDGWKQAPAMGRRNNQTFCHLPHKRLIEMIRYKAAERGMKVILTEESYTSKASFLDQDPLPRYDEEGTWSFTGRRIYRGLYTSPQGLIHADVNGAANIMRKVFPNVSAKEANGIEGLDGHQTINVSTPLVLSLLR